MVVRSARPRLTTRLLAIALLAAAGGLSISPGRGRGAAGASALGLSVRRISGTDAIGTSIAVSQAEFPAAGSARAVVLARSDFFSDALVGGPLAAKVGGPLLITPGAQLATALDPRVEAEIQRVLPAGDTVYLLGGDLALSPNIDTTLEGLGYTVVREAGADEYATAVDIAEALGNPATVFEATGLNFPDALSAVPAAIAVGGAVLLTDGTTQAPETAAYLAAHPADARYAVGGPLAAAGADPGAHAVYGPDPYGTSAAVAGTFFPQATAFGAATGADFPDALSGGVFMGAPATRGPVLLVPPAGPLPSAIAGYLAGVASTLTEGYLFGGPLAVGNDVFAELGGTPACPANLADELASTGSATSLMTVDAPAYGSTTATFTAWQLENGCWEPVFGPWTAHVGTSGVSDHKHEGDGATPTGSYTIGPTMYGVLPDPGVSYQYHQLVCGDWWDEDPSSATYDTFQHVGCGAQPPFGGDSEALWTAVPDYDYFAVIDYNDSPVVAGAGSAIFLHVDDGSPTAGCVSLPEADLVSVLDWLSPQAAPIIVIGTDAEIRGF
jgi:L,D-peptidoglycan transpeptidase YkuD (ErfK/YbiS/YcfS/YnhG family)